MTKESWVRNKLPSPFGLASMNQKWDLPPNPNCRRCRVAMKSESPPSHEAVAFAEGSSCESVIVTKQPPPSQHLKDEDRESCELRHQNTGEGS
ncbi:hypothetical protein TIFTF001_004205 [Ficus carica]|uniref:Uncharacterized protein n=1 Tax=Ficus carica TaxID=3494 RepID=A0AA87ZK19_FICCA|nr:hypothetical protein TIFTF001_004205 [Ficus carica]